MPADHHSRVEMMIDQIIADGRLTGAEKRQLDALVLADGKLTFEERKAMDRLIEMIARGELEVVD